MVGSSRPQGMSGRLRGILTALLTSVPLYCILIIVN